ncbi:helix-hairpin-helix domain-containing protein [Listeria rocourtiae]|uniref:helix-hairpin-helix domain-containing protein n=1 Tax=Listeria rocourtiae TaxID=647910 RepID=UPI003D2F7D08
MLDKWQAYKKYIIGLAVIIATISLFFFTQNQEEVVPSTPVAAKEETTKNDAKEQEVVSTKMLIVDVKGAVNKPGVYELAPDSRVKDAIIKAGGLTAEADAKLLNMAQKVTDEMVVYAGKAGEEGVVPVVTNGSETASGDNAKVNINTADVATLQAIPGIGATKAQAIIDYREKEGLFTTNADLSKVSGIGAKTVERLSEHITVE